MREMSEKKVPRGPRGIVPCGMSYALWIIQKSLPVPPLFCNSPT